MFKKVLVIVLSLMLLVFAAAGCGQQQTSAGNAAAPAAKPVELKFALSNAPGSDPEKIFEAMKKELEEKSNGRIKVTIFAGDTLCKGPDMYQAVVNGLADLAWGPATQVPGILPLSQVTTLPMLNIANCVNASKAMYELYDNNKDLQREYKDVNVFGLSPSGGAVIGTNNKLVKTLDDLKGMRIRVSPGPQTEFMKLAGANPMNVPITEAWEAMDKKTMDGYVFGFSAVSDWKLADVTRYWTIVNIYSPTLYLIMNKAKFDSLPEDLKPVVKEALANANTSIGKQFDKETQDYIDKLQKDFKDTTYILPAGEAAKWQALAPKAWQTWFDSEAKNNRPAKDVTDQFIKLLDKYQAR